MIRRGAIARVQMKTSARPAAKVRVAEARLDLGKVKFLDALPSNAVKDPAAFATVVVEKLGAKWDAAMVDAITISDGIAVESIRRAPNKSAKSPSVISAKNPSVISAKSPSVVSAKSPSAIRGTKTSRGRG